MCGIAGIHAPGGEADPRVVAAMTARLVHRGPDGDGFFDAPGIALGMRRLAIIDPEGGHQPLFNESRDVVAVFNGELYNHAELRAGSRGSWAPAQQRLGRRGHPPPVRGGGARLRRAPQRDLRDRAVGRARARAAPLPRSLRRQAPLLRARGRPAGLRLRGQGAAGRRVDPARRRPGRGGRVPHLPLRPLPAHRPARRRQAAPGDRPELARGRRQGDGVRLRSSPPPSHRPRRPRRRVPRGVRARGRAPDDERRPDRRDALRRRRLRRGMRRHGEARERGARVHRRVRRGRRGGRRDRGGARARPTCSAPPTDRS